MYNESLLKNFFGERLFLFDTIDSTNNFLKTCSQKNAVCIADGQTAGRGRLGRSFESAKGMGIYISFSYDFNEIAQNIAEVTGAAAVLTCRAIQSVCGVMPQIKWVNDLLINEKKVCGILCEKSADKVIIGIGINVFGDDFSEEVRKKASSIKVQTGKNIEREALIIKLCENIDKLCQSIDKDEILDFYRKNCQTLGKKVFFERDGVTKNGVAEKIEDDFSITVLLESGEIENINYGEVSVRNLY